MRFTLNLKTKIIGLMLLILLASFWLQVIISSHRIEHDMVDVLSAQQLSVAHYIAADIDEKFRFRIEMLEGVASNLRPELLADKNKANLYLQDHPELTKLFKGGVAMVGADGIGIADYPPARGRQGGSFKQLQYFNEVMATGAVAFGQPRIGLFTKKPGVAIGVPVRDKAGALIGMLEGFSTFSDTSLFGQVEKATYGKSGYVVIVDPKYNLIATASDPSRILTARPKPGENKGADKLFADGGGSIITVNSKGIETLTAADRIASSQWMVFVVLPTEEAFAPIRELQHKQYIVAILLSALAAVIAWWLLYRSLRPLKTASDAIQGMVRGNSQLHELPVLRNDEIGSLLASFNLLVEQRRKIEGELSESHQRLAYLAYHDKLTDLPNRSLLADRLHQALAQATWRKELLAVCYLDLDGFKPVNDAWGHDFGDRLLVEVARRLQGCVRAGDTVARMGGDEFVVLLSNIREELMLEQIVRHMLDVIAEPYSLDNVRAELTMSVGVTVFPSDQADDADTLIRHADQAMYIAKRTGKNRMHMFDAESDRRLREHHDLFSRVVAALQQDELRLYYQPKVNMRSGRVVGAEALIRWQHPEQGVLAPNVFLPVVENTEFAIPLGEWVIREALRQMQAWAAAGLVLPVSVNVFGYHLQRPDFVDRLAAILAEFPDVQPAWLELEILETTAMQDLDEVSNVIRKCMALGVSFALDDFGTGYSSLTYFRHLPVNLLKIDRSFVIDVLSDAEDLALVEGIVGLVRSLQREVIAEGVETVEHGIPLLRIGCDLAQGYGIARPMPAEQISAWVAQWRVPQIWQDVVRG